MTRSNIASLFLLGNLFLGFAAIVDKGRAAEDFPGYKDWQFEGVVTFADPALSFREGDDYFIRFSWNEAQPEEHAPGVYYPTVGYLFQAGEYAFGASSLGSGVVVVDDRPNAVGGSMDAVHFGFFGASDPNLPAGLNYDGLDAGLTLVQRSPGPASPPFHSTLLPGTLDLNDFSQRSMAVYFLEGGLGDPLLAQGSVDRLYIDGVLVPEPRVMTLLVAGVLAGLTFVGARGKKRRSGDCHAAMDEPPGP